jgi:hypothetical protein
MVYTLHVIYIQGAQMSHNCGNKYLGKQTMQNQIVAFIKEFLRTDLCFTSLLFWHHWFIQQCHWVTCLDPLQHCHLVWGVWHHAPQMSPLHWTHAPKLQAFRGTEMHPAMRRHIVGLFPGDDTASYQSLKAKFVSSFPNKMFPCWTPSIQNI